MHGMMDPTLESWEDRLTCCLDLRFFCFVYYFPFSNFSVLGTEMVKNIGDKDNFSFDSATKI